MLWTNLRCHAVNRWGGTHQLVASARAGHGHNSALPLSRTPPAGPPIISASNLPGPVAVPRRPAQSSGLPQRHPVFFGRRRCCSLRPKAASIPSSTQRRRIRSTVALAISRDRATSSSVRPPSFRASSLSNRMRAWVCLYAAARPLGNQGLQFPVALPQSVRYGTS